MLGSRVCMSQVDWRDSVDFDVLNPIVKIIEWIKQFKSNKGEIMGF